MLYNSSYNNVFKSDKPVKPVCGLKQCYDDRHTGLPFKKNI